MARSTEKLSSQTEILKLPYLVLIVSMLITLGATFIFYKSAQAKDNLRFQNEVARVENRLQVLLGAYVAVIKAGRGYIESTENLTRQKFSNFVQSLELNKNYRGIQGIGYIKSITAAEQKELTKRMQAEQFPDFKIFPENESLVKQTVIYFEPPEEDNLRLIGFDMAGEISRNRALARARDTSEATATGKINLTLDTESENSTGFLIFVPVFKGKKPETIEERRSSLDGYVFGSFRESSFLQDVQNSISVSDIAVTIYESERASENILAQTAVNSIEVNEGFSTTTELEVAGRKWIVEYHTLPVFALQSSTGWTPLIFISGLIFSMLFFGITYLESYARVNAEKISSDLQESEREKGFLLEREQLERKRAEEASKAKDEFISIVSHELRTPLNAIAGWTKVLYAENLTPKIKKQALQKIDKNLRTQTFIVEELLDFSQLVSKKINLNQQKTDFSKLFEDAFSQVAALAQDKEIQLIKENSLNGQRVYGDDERLKKVIKNLLANAVKFTPKGGAVTARVEEKDSAIKLTIKDNGQGIKPDFLPQIFERFKQADSSTTRKHGGLGLGLAITRHIVKLHGGSIEAASEGEGKGATFIVKLPCNKTHSS